MPSPDSWGGPIACEPYFVEALRDLGIDVTEEIYVYGDKDKPTPFFQRIQRVISTAFRFRKLLRKQDFDIIHFNTAFDLKTILRDSFTLFLLQPKAKIFFKLHGSEAENFSQSNLLTKYLIRYLASKVDGFGVLSREERGNFMKLGFDATKLFLVKNAISISRDSSIFGNNSNDISRLLFVSRFVSTKGLLESIQACAFLREKGIKFVLTCVGDGEIRRIAEQEVNRLGLQTYVKFTGYVDEIQVSKYLQTSDIFIFPTRHPEGFPMVLFKAVAAGIPIVSTKTRAAADHLLEGKNCLFCTQSPENIAEKLIYLIENKDVTASISRNNVELGRSLLPEKIALEFIEIYEKILKS